MIANRFYYTVSAVVVGVMGLWAVTAVGPRTGERTATAAEIGKPTDGLGYGAAFDAELRRIGQISPQEFARRYAPTGKYLPRLTWDPTTARYWDRFLEDPTQPGWQVRLRGEDEKRVRDQAKREGRPIPEGQPVTGVTYPSYSFRPNDEELARFKANGFVVSERMGGPSCTELYYRIYKRDLPVFVSTDAVLHAWHRSFDAILEEVETAVLAPALADILAGMADRLPEAKSAYGDGPTTDALADADYFLAVARSLLTGAQVKTAFGNDRAVAETLRECAALQMRKFELFDRARHVDFSQFKPRGHYEKSEPLQRYFRAMMWCGRIDLRVAGDPKEASPRQLAGAVVLHDLLKRSGRFGRWEQFDRMLTTFVGRADSMTFGQLGEVLKAGGVRSPADLKDEAALTALRDRITAGDFGAQEIRGDVFAVDPLDAKTYALPRSFTFIGQRFAVDSWALAKVVFDDVVWEDGRHPPKVMRRVPSALDVAFAALGNDHAVPTLADRMTDRAGRRFRDGLNYQHNLAAVRNVIDRQTEAAWSDSLYTGWLGSLRELSRPTTDGRYPEAMRTRAWAMKSLNTQLASWTQLRHDTVLYVKQSYTAMPACHYPAGYVEPVPHFWARLGATAARAAGLIERTPYADPAVQAKQAKFLRRFAATTATLRAIAEKELAQQELSKEETKFLEDVVEVTHVPHGSGSKRQYAGWYPNLFYTGGDDSTRWDALVADVHTNTPAPEWGDPGCVLHGGVGQVDLLIVAVDCGKDRMVYAGPVMSHYEFEVPGIARKTDAEWKTDLAAGKAPPRPEWTRGYLVPGENPERRNYLSLGH